MTDIATIDPEQRRKVALLKAVGLDRVPPEQREIALAIAKRYDLDLMLRHLVLVDGRPYIPRDALLHIAHRSGQFDGIEVSEPVVEGDYWRATATVHRKDMSHAFTYPGRYPVKGKNSAFAPEMAIKVAESMALRRAFNVAAPVVEERWDTDVPVAEPPAPQTLSERVAQKRAEIAPPVRQDDDDRPVLVSMPLEESDRLPVLCGNVDLALDTGECTETIGHPGPHKNDGGVWPAGKP